MAFSVREGPNKLLCYICGENFECVQLLHCHQINSHSKEELSFAIISLKGINLEGMKNVYHHLTFNESGNDMIQNNSETDPINAENFESEIMVNLQIPVYENEHFDSLIKASSSKSSRPINKNSGTFTTDDNLKQVQNNEKSENASTVPKSECTQISLYPNVTFSPNNSPCPQSHIKAIISRLPNIVTPEKQQLNDSYVLPSPVSQRHRSSVLYDYERSNIKYGDYFVPLVEFESAVDAACGVEKQVRNTKTQTGLMSVITQQLATYRKQKAVLVNTSCEKNLALSLGEKRIGYEKTIQELPASRTRDKNNFQNLTLDTKFTCWTCGNSYKKKSHLKRHIRFHTGERPFVCPYCEKQFAVRSIMQQHIRIHTGEKPYSCKMCHQSFRQKSGLLTHTMLHTGKPFKCDHCNKAFINNSRLMQHLRSHAGPRMNICRTCGAQFYTAGALKQHSLSHYLSSLKIKK